ncbi:MAG: DUF3006 domain-containing protein [Candidatus Calescibacterium sp.]|nr:DUF3006 domain-containing protein [Candidatus Calescibacterium sp.]MCX7758205.1 DUF3006 domain-containing protein [bacterium]
MSKKKYVLVVTEINSKWVKLCFEDGQFITIPREKLPENMYVGQVVEISIKTTTLLTILKEIENIAKKDKDFQGEINSSSVKIE